MEDRVQLKCNAVMSCRSVPVFAKAQAIRDVASGKKKSEVAKSLGVPRSTLNNWLKNQDKIISAVDQAVFSTERKRMRSALHSNIDECLLRWFRETRAHNLPINGLLLSTKSEEFAAQLGIADFKCSDGWLERFKARHAISVKQICGEGTSAPVETWKSVTVQNILREFMPQDIYNADETGLFYQLLPNKTLGFKGEKCIGGKNSKNRLTVLVMANMDGSDKRKLLVIGKSLNPRCFKGVKHLPVDYTANKKAWMVSDLFEKFVRKFDKEMATKKRKIALIVDNCPAHSVIDGLAAVTVKFLPPNTTSHTQPMDAGVIKNLKHYYRQLLLSKVLMAMDSGEEFSVDVLGAIHLLKQAWERVLPETIAHCFCHSGFQLQYVSEVTPDECSVSQGEMESEGSLELVCEQLKSHGMWPENLAMLEYLNADEDVCVSEQTLDQEIVAAVLEKDEEHIVDEELSDDDEQEQIAQTQVKLQDAMKAVDTLQLYLAQNNIDSEPYKLSSLSSMITLQACQSKRQKLMTDYV